MKKENFSLNISSESSNQTNINEQKSTESDFNEFKNIDFPLTDQIILHNKLEIIEHRIHFDIDRVHGHPCQCIAALDENPNIKLTEADEEMENSLSNYKIENPIQLVPDFWPSRIYDEDYTTYAIQKLNKKQSEILQNKIIEEQNQIGKFQLKKHTIKTNNKTYKHSMFRTRRNSYDLYPELQVDYKKHNDRYSNFMLRLPARLYDTDDYIDETDGELF